MNAEVCTDMQDRARIVEMSNVLEYYNTIVLFRGAGFINQRRRQEQHITKPPRY